MPMLCKVAAGFSDTRCPVCGQAFLVYETLRPSGNNRQRRLQWQMQLRAQHTLSDHPEVHPPTFRLADAPVSVTRPVPQPVGASPVPAFNQTFGKGMPLLRYNGGR